LAIVLNSLQPHHF